MKNPKISIIVATGKNREIGKKNSLLWHIPEELKRFREITTGHPIIMGRKTYQSVGKPLPNRTNIIVTHSASFARPHLASSDLIIVHSLKEAIEQAKKIESQTSRDREIFVIGGAQIYEQALPIADKLYLTIVEEDFPEADSYLSDYSDFKKVIFEKEMEVEGTKGGIPQSFKIRFLELEK